MSQAHDRLNKAIEVLATGEGRVKERLGDALAMIATVEPADFPEEPLRTRFATFLEELRLDRAHGSGLTTQATVDRLSRYAAAHAAQRLLDLGYTLRLVRADAGADARH